MKISKYFTVQELVNPDIINVLGEERAANAISVHLLKELDRLRAKFGPIYINTGSYINSGLRKASFYKKFGVMRESYSTHQYGNTADLKFRDVTPIEAYNYIINNQNKFPLIVRMENAHKTKTWLHVECGPYKRKKEIEVFNP